MRKYGKLLLVLGVLAASPAWVNADGFFSGLRSTQSSKLTQKQLNQQKAEQVAGALKQARLNGYDFEVEVRGDTVKLEGKVRDVTHRALASNVSRKVAGIKKVQNNLKYVPAGNVQQAGGTGQRDGLLNSAGIEQVRFSKPGRHKKPSTRSASVQPVRRPVVQNQVKPQPKPQPKQPDAPVIDLNPPAANFAAKPAAPAPAAVQQAQVQQAQEPAKPFINLTSGSSQAAPAGPTNQQVAEGIAQQLATVGLVGYDVTARYEKGVATLEGEVANMDQVKAAEYATSLLPSVRSVVNKLKVGQPIAQTAYAGQGGQIQPVAASYPAYPAQLGHSGVPGQLAAQGHPGAQFQPGPGGPVPSAVGAAGNYSNPQLPAYAWPSQAAYPNSAAIQYPKQYSASAWPYIGPFHPYPQVPLGWREVSMEWDDGLWQLDFNQKKNAWYWLLAPRNW